MSKPKYAVATDDKGRHYVHPTSGEMWPSVTNILDVAVAKPALTGWAAKITAENFWTRLPDAVNASMNGTSARDTLLREIKGQIKVVRESAAGLGTRVHDHAECIALGKTPPDDPEVAPYAEQLARFFRDFNVDLTKHVHAAEATIINRTVGYAGTADVWVELPVSPAGEWTPRKRWLYLCDYKSSAGRPVDSTYPEQGCQLAALSMAESLLLDDGTEVDPPGPILATAIINLRTNDYAFIPMPADRDAAFKAFKGAAAMTKYMHSLSGKPAVWKREA